jgi:hypothetical protein
VSHIEADVQPILADSFGHIACGAPFVGPYFDKAAGSAPTVAQRELIYVLEVKPAFDRLIESCQDGTLLYLRLAAAGRDDGRTTSRLTSIMKRFNFFVRLRRFPTDIFTFDFLATYHIVSDEASYCATSTS